MEKQFVTYELAVKLKELGFDEPCFSYYTVFGNFAGDVSNDRKYNSEFEKSGGYISAPLWQQVFDWFHKEHNLFAEFSFNTLRSKYDWCIPVNINKGYCSQEEYDTYEETRLECLRKLIKIIEDEKL